MSDLIAGGSEIVFLPALLLHRHSFVVEMLPLEQACCKCIHPEHIPAFWLAQGFWDLCVAPIPSRGTGNPDTAHIPSKHETIARRSFALGHLSAGMAQSYASIWSAFTQKHHIA